jgi:hypothetical protein
MLAAAGLVANGLITALATAFPWDTHRTPHETSGAVAAKR